MKLNHIKYIVLAAGLSFAGCKRVLNLQPTDKLTADAIFGDPQGVKVFMANLYYQLPVEDFTYFRGGFNQNGGDPNNGGFAPAMGTDEAAHSEFGDFVGDGDFQWWDQGYKLIRDVNLLIDYIPTLSIRDDEKAALVGESAFIKAFAYFALAKRYGGVPLMKQSQVFDGDPEKLKVPRSTEKQTWDYVMELCDQAITNLSATKNPRRATKWTAYALKSRAALHAASVAKFGNRITMTGDAATQKLVGMDAADANGYYQACIAASQQIINSGYGLFKPSPANPTEAAENYRSLFQDPNVAINDEVIMIKGFALRGANLGHNYDIWYTPAQLSNGWPHPGRMNPTLDLVDQYESYNTPGVSSPVNTRVDGNITDYNGFNSGTNYIRYNTPNEIFANKDARLWGTAILPSTTFKGVPIIIQAGYVKPDGNAVIRTKDQITVSGTTYYSYGAPDVSMYSGFDTYGGNNTRTGFSFKKFISTSPVINGWNNSTSDWAEFRFAEVLLNMAEAVVESGQGDVAAATKALNDVRKRAGHTTNITLTSENVQRERRVELAFENKRFWDLIRRREFHTEFNNRFLHSLLPLQDLRALPDIKYIFVRVNVPNTNTKTFQPRSYYRFIPGIGSNGLVQNPQY
jgi:hypothetical protein